MMDKRLYKLKERYKKLVNSIDYSKPLISQMDSIKRANRLNEQIQLLKVGKYEN